MICFKKKINQGKAARFTSVLDVAQTDGGHGTDQEFARREKRLEKVLVSSPFSVT